MTQNQINYARVREEQRHNLATEGQAALELRETSRHNVQGETETNRHNVVSEGIDWYKASETGRHNVSTENIDWYTAQSQKSLNDSSAWRNYAEGTLASLRGEYLEKDYQLARDKFNQTVWRDVREVGLEESRYQLSESEFNAKLDELLFRQGLDTAKLGLDTSRYKAQAFRDYSSGAKSLTDAFLEVFDRVWGIVNGRTPNK